MTETVTINPAATTTEPTLEEQAKAAGIDLGNVDPTAETQQAEVRPSWLPEKFKTAEDFAKSYAELEKKLGEGRSEEAPAPKPEETVEAKPDPQATTIDEAKEAVEKAGLDFDQLSAEYWEKGELSAERYAELEKAGIPKSMVDQFAAGQQALIQLERQEAFNIVGGEDAYGDMVKWAADSLTPKEIETYDKAVNGNDKDARQMAIKGLQARYQGKVGKEPTRTVSGARPTDSVYESIAQLQTDMRDPRYSKDPAFIRSVEAKLARSNIF